MELFNYGNKWTGDPGSVELKVDVFFRGMGGMNDCATLLRHVSKHYFHPQQAVMYQGIELPGHDGFQCAGETTIGLLWTVPKDKVDQSVKELYECLSNRDDISDVDFDQYSKMQVNHQIDNGEWSEVVEIFK